MEKITSEGNGDCKKGKIRFKNHFKVKEERNFALTKAVKMKFTKKCAENRGKG